MTDTRDAAEAAFDSTFLDASQPADKPLSDAAFQAPPDQPAQPKTEEQARPDTRDAISKALDDLEAKEAKDKPADDKKPDEADKAKPEQPKTEDKASKPRADDGKFAKAEEPKDGAAKVEQSAPEKAPQGQEAEAARQSEGRKHVEPPARFLPEARQKWANVPNEVKAEVHRVSQEYETEIERVRPAVEAYESVKEYDDLAKNSGTTMRDAMERYVTIDKLLISHPEQGIARILQSIGVTPEQLADALTKNPDAFRVQQQQAPTPPQPQASPDTQRLTQEVSDLKAFIMSQHVEQQARPIIETFAAAHPDYYDLQPAIKTVLESGVVEKMHGKGLTPEQRLSVAYRMAGGNAPSQSAAPPALAHSSADDDRLVDPAGQKSVRGAPAAGFDTQVKRPKNNRDAAAAALAELGI